jgi:hypothetical protein
MISGVGETQEYRNEKWELATDCQREKYNRDMKEWALKHPFAALVMGGASKEEILKDAKARFCKS